ncbi:hypothetical protein SAMN02745883_01171 [Caminicella sporogenes DSM 14501]|uniref:Uncharacterized protein n=1 Tax=Caminicella sporogenes DSM 14501 TaxID=1121266 RepID=A0A1M6PEF1_9FIRM|nr:hypothetical protein [Caminicella sporogenes]RKD21429.1 hypothetical protein BET04_08300 [Caminicella sporogenes]SHK06329.1 hypothetical protein SAMN02745883_01171 [Caminicella sporogenes DSM 14501]
MSESRIDYVIKKLRRKIWIDRIQQYTVYAFCIGAVGISILIIIGHAYPIIYLFKKAIVLMSVVVLLGILAGLLHRPSLKYTAYVGDELDFENRFTTYMEYKKVQNPIVEVFKEEVEYALEQKNILREYSFHFCWKIAMVGFFILVLAVGLYFIPSNGMKIAKYKEEIHEELKKESKKIQRVVKELKEDIDEDKRENVEYTSKIMFNLQELEKKLSKSFDYKEAAFHVADVQNKIKKCCSNINNEDKSLYTGIFNGIEGNHQILKQAVDNDDMSKVFNILKDEYFTKEEKKKILENIENIKSSFKDKEYINSIANKIKTALKRENTGGALADILQEQYYKKRELKIAQKTIVRLQNMKERLIDKAFMDGFKSFDGDKKGADFARGGENELFRDGELSNIKADEFAIGSEGNKLMGNADGVGGGSKDAQSNTGEVKTGEISKGSDATRLGLESKNISYLQGSFQETGKIIDKKVRAVIGDTGNLKELQRLYKSFQKEGMDYILKQEIPLEYKQLIINYFDKLSGGK